METLDDLVQGSPEWRAARRNYFTASEAAAMMGAGYTSRDDLLAEKSSGFTREITPQLQALFDRGHAAEARARPIAEEIAGTEFFPVVGVSDCGRFLASFDGLSMDEQDGFEHKLLNQKVVAQIDAEDLDPKYYWQFEHQLMVSGANGILFACSDGTKENFHCMYYLPAEGRREQLIAGWDQFEKDLATYVPKEAEAVLVAQTIESLPALTVEVSGEVRASNIAIFQDAARDFIARINMSPETDQDFVNAENAVKECKKAEEKIAAAKAHMMGQMATVDEIHRAVDSIAETIAQARIALGKTIKIKKEERKASIVAFGKNEVAMHLNEIRAGFPDGIQLPAIPDDFATATKNKRTLTSLESAVNDEAARIKIEASTVAAAMMANYKVFETLAGEHRFLFPDVQQLILKAPDDMDAVIQKRFADHKAAEQEKADRLAEQNRQREEAEQRQVEAAPVVETETAGCTWPEPEPSAEPIAAEADDRPLTDYERGYIDGIKVRDAQLKTLAHPPAVAEIITDMLRRRAA